MDGYSARVDLVDGVDGVDLVDENIFEFSEICVHLREFAG